MRTPFIALIITLLLLGCQEYPQELPEGHERNTTAEIPLLPASFNATAGTCAPDLLLAGEQDGYKVGLVNLTIEDRGTYYKITKATVYAEAQQWYLNDITIEITEPNATLMAFTKQQLPISPASSCFVQELNMSIALKTLGERKVTVLLGQGQNRAGTRLATASGTLDLRDFVR